jgi:integrase
MSIHKKPNNKYEVRYRDEGGKQRSKTFTRKKDAESYELAVKLRRERGEQLDPSLGNTTVGTFFRDVFIPTRTVRASTVRNYHVRWAPKGGKPWNVATKFDRMALRAANTPATIIAWHREMREASATPAMMASAHALLVQVLKLAVDLEYLPRLRIGSMRPEYTPTPAADPWLPDSVERLREGLATLEQTNRRPKSEWTWARQRDRVLVSLMAYMPLRLGEAATVRWEDVTDGGKIAQFATVRRHVAHPDDSTHGTKTVDVKLVEIPGPVREELRAWRLLNARQPLGPVAPYTEGGAEWTHTRLGSWRDQIWYRALAHAGLPKVSPKHLRHSAISMWIRERRDIKTVADAAGNSVAVCAEVYAHAFTKALRSTETFDLDAAIRAARNAELEAGRGEGGGG